MPHTWYKVDNVAKVFLASVTRRDPRVFRISCTLTEEINPDALAAALQRTARDLPHFSVTLHRGLFWHYLEQTDKVPTPVPETQRPCAAIYGRDLKNALLYRVSYYRRRINLEVFHALSDGSGGVVFLQTLVYTNWPAPRASPAQAPTIWARTATTSFMPGARPPPCATPPPASLSAGCPGGGCRLTRPSFLKGTFLSKRCWPARAPWMFR